MFFINYSIIVMVCMRNVKKNVKKAYEGSMQNSFKKEVGSRTKFIDIELVYLMMSGK